LDYYNILTGGIYPTLRDLGYSQGGLIRKEWFGPIGIYLKVRNQGLINSHFF